DPALLEYADHGLVKLRVFPIPEDGTRRVEIEYAQVLPTDGGLFRYRHPLGAEIRGGEVESVTARIEIRSDQRLAGITSPTHTISVDRVDERSAVIGYEGTGADEGDLVLYVGLTDGEIGAHLVTYADPAGGDDGFFLLMLSPGLADDDEVVAKDVILVIDRSGSMEGEKFEQAQTAAEWVLRHLNEDDRFGVITFSTGVREFSPDLSDTGDIPDAIDWIASQEPAGSTDIDMALSSAFEMASDRPAYVVFLTDGLPTEGVTDTAAIIDRAGRRAPENVSLFAFGVGWDVDTVLLDTLATEHHGTSTYVTRGESVDEAVTALYAKVSSPVLTDVSIDVSGVTLSDIYPRPLPDLFSGGQTVIAGRFDGSGAAVITVTGWARDEQIALEYEATFPRTGGNEAIPRLWATRKVGYLLRDVRLNGPSEETIDQIVRLAIRYGIVTPYTSYLVTEDTPFGAEAIERITDKEYAAAVTTTLVVSGEAAVDAAAAAGGLADSDVTASSSGYGEILKTAGSRTFRLTDGVWIDTAWDPDNGTTPVEFLSADYFALTAAHPDLGTALSVGDRVIVTWGDVAYEVVEEGTGTGSIDIPVIVEDHGTGGIVTESTTVVTGATTGGSTGESLAAGEIDPGSDSSPTIIIAIAAGALAIGGGLVAAAKRR
ncbi:VWA domain-containing protein, partial [bacterium]|nr:VWA domain-containing protein [bacterium]